MTGGENPSSWVTRAKWGGASVGGVLCTIGVFLFLGSLQPPLSDTERIELPAIIKFDLSMAKAKKPPPPPQNEKPKTERTRRKRERPKEKTKHVARQQVTRRPRRAPTSNAPRMRADLAMGLQGISLAAAGGSMGGGLSLQIPTEVQEFAAEAMDLLDYEERRRRVREMQSYQRDRQSGIASAGGAAAAARLVRRYDPQYPPAARAKEIEGYVLLDVLIGVDGKIEEFEIVEADPQEVFEEAIRKAMPRWQFAPAKDASGRPIEERRTFRYEFKLEDG